MHFRKKVPIREARQAESLLFFLCNMLKAACFGAFS